MNRIPGVVFYQMATLQLPFEAHDAQVWPRVPPLLLLFPIQSVRSSVRSFYSVFPPRTLYLDVLEPSGADTALLWTCSLSLV